MSEDTYILKTGEFEAAIIAGQRIAAQETLGKASVGKEKRGVIIPPGCEVKFIDAQLENPIRKKGERVFTQPESFCWYVNKHKHIDRTIAVADEDAGKIQAVLNDHGEEQPEWGDFTACLKMDFSEQWEIWLGKNGEMFNQIAFADFIEDNRGDLKTGEFQEPSGETIKNLSSLELNKIITDMQLFSEENVVSKVDRRTGAMTVNYENTEHEKNEIKLPEALYLAIPIYKGGDFWQVKARLRIRKQGPAVKFYYLLDQVPVLKRKAFQEICGIVEKGKGEDVDGLGFSGVDLPILHGIIEVTLKPSLRIAPERRTLPE